MSYVVYPFYGEMTKDAEEALKKNGIEVTDISSNHGLEVIAYRTKKRFRIFPLNMTFEEFNDRIKQACSMMYQQNPSRYISKEKAYEAFLGTALKEGNVKASKSRKFAQKEIWGQK